MGKEEEIRAVMGDVVQARFYPHRILENGDILTVRMKKLVLTPAAELWCGDRFLGLVNCVKPGGRERWIVGLAASGESFERDESMPAGIPAHILALLEGQGITTRSALEQTSRAQLVSIKGIGFKTADGILEALHGE